MSEVIVKIPKTIYVETEEKSYVVEGTFSFPIGDWLLSEELKDMISTIECKVITLSTRQRENKKCRFLREDGGCDLGPKDGCIFTTEEQMCGQPNSPKPKFRV